MDQCFWTLQVHQPRRAPRTDDPGTSVPGERGSIQRPADEKESLLAVEGTEGFEQATEHSLSRSPHIILTWGLVQRPPHQGEGIRPVHWEVPCCCPVDELGG